jgi:peptidoglycan/LPS O-acetylase OafA/YrhL
MRSRARLRFAPWRRPTFCARDLLRGIEMGVLLDHIQVLSVPRQRIKGRERFVALDGLRGIAAICVVIFHGLGGYGLQAYLPHAHLAVDFFFMLSGFVLANAYTHRIAGGMTVKQFLLIRLVRLYPLYAVGLLLGFGIFCAKVYLQRKDIAVAELGEALFLALWFLPTSQELAQGWETAFPLDPPAWSLFFEWLANIAWSAILVHLARPKLAILLCLLGAGYFAQSLHFDGVRGGNFYDNLDLGFLRVAFPFLAGVMLFTAKPRPDSEPRDLRVLALVVFLVVLLALPWERMGVSQGLFEGAAVCFAFPALIFLGAKVFPTRHAAMIMSWLGEISYAVYIVHYPLIHIFNNSARAWATSFGKVALLLTIQLAMILAVSQILIYFWDIPVRTYLSRRLAARPSSGPASTASSETSDRS